MIRSLFILLFSAGILFAQLEGSSAEDQAHQQLRDLRTEMYAAIESRDIDRMLSHMHPDVVTTWQDGKTTHGIDELRAFYDELGKDAFVSFKVPHKPDGLSSLHGDDTAVSTGFVTAYYKLLGKDYELTSRWTATLVRQDDKWLVAAYQVSLNALDNPLLNGAKSALWIAGALGLIIGGVLVFVVMRKRKS